MRVISSVTSDTNVSSTNKSYERAAKTLIMQAKNVSLRTVYYTLILLNCLLKFIEAMHCFVTFVLNHHQCVIISSKRRREL